MVTGVLGCQGLIRLGRHEPPPGRVIVVHVGVEGADQVDEDDVVSGLKTFADNFGSFENKPLLDLSQLDEDDRRVESEYAARGFFDAKCTGHRVEAVDEVSVRVFFRVNEGKPTRVARVIISGLEDSPDDPAATARLVEVREDLADLVQMEAGDIWTEAEYRDSKARLYAELRSHGFVYAEVVGETLIDKRGHKAEPVFEVVPGPLPRIESIHVLGNATVSKERILRRVDLVPGEIVDPNRFEKIEGRISDLGVFFSVSVNPERKALDVALDGREGTAEVLRTLEWPKTVQIAVTVQERPFQEIRTGAGVALENEQSNVSLLGGYQNLSLFGGERFFDFSLRPAYIVLPSFFEPPTDHGPGGKAILRFKQPSFFEEYLLLSFAADYEIGLDARGYLQTLATGLTFSRLFFDFLTPFVGYKVSLDHYVTGDIPQGNDRFITLTKFEEGFTVDWRDNLLDARSGVFARVAVGQSAPEIGSDYRYISLESDVRGYVKPAEWLTLALRASYSQNFPFNNTQDEPLPVVALFKGGGASDMRGFSSNLLGPTTCSAPDGETFVRDGYPCPEGSEPFQDGGNIKFVSGFETRFYLPYDLGLVAFVDVGQIWTFASDIDWTDLEIAVGPGFRYYTIIGPIRADFAFLLTAPSGFEWQFHISIGQAF